MRDVVSPIFLRLGARLRGPDPMEPGKLRRVTISNIVCYETWTKYCTIISGIPGHEIEDVTLSNIRVWSKGGGTKEIAAVRPAENEKNYPEPTMFGEMPAYGLYARHVRSLKLLDVDFNLLSADERPAVVFDDVKAATTQRAPR
jgi:hypothetical protein